MSTGARDSMSVYLSQAADLHNQPLNETGGDTEQGELIV
jgi:hypothetical protein